MANKIMYEASKFDLISAPIPEMTRTYKPVENAKLIDLTLNSIEKAGFKLDGETYTWAREGKQCNGRYRISDVADSEMQLQIGWQNSYDKSLSLKFALGANIFICTNGCVSGDMGNFKKKHVGEVQEFTPQAISEYIKAAGDNFYTLQKQRERMKDIELTKRTTSELLGRMFIEEELITSTQLNIIKREMEEPTHDYNAKDSVWELYNYSTFAYKEEHPANWLKSHINLHSFIVDEFGILNREEIVLNELILS